MIYTAQTKTIIAQLCRFPEIGLPVLSKNQWLEVLEDLINSKISMDIFINEETGQPRLFALPKHNEFWKISKIVDGLVFLTNGNEVITENQLIYRYRMGNRLQHNRVIYLSNNAKAVKLELSKISDSEIDKISQN